MNQPVVYHIPVCPFAQRVEILLTLKDRHDEVEFHVLDITRPRPDWFLEKTGGSTASPVLETASGDIIKESLVILQYLEDVFPEPPVARQDPYRRAVENMLVLKADDFGNRGYAFVMNQDPEKRDSFRENMLEEYAQLNDFLERYARSSPFLFEEFGWAETVFTPLFMRFWFLEYYEDFELPEDIRKSASRSGELPRITDEHKRKILGANYADLIGLAVVDRSGAPLGRVRALHDFGAGDVVEIDLDGGKSVMIPFTRDVVPEIDLAAGRIIADPPRGTLDDGSAEEGER
jgi:glutathione S-transferase